MNKVEKLKPMPQADWKHYQQMVSWMRTLEATLGGCHARMHQNCIENPERVLTRDRYREQLKKQIPALKDARRFLDDLITAAEDYE